MPKAEGRHYRFEKYEFWAERGMISLIDTELAADSETTEQYHWRIRCGEFMKRAIAAMMHEPDKYASKLAALRTLLDNAKTACLLAKAQGDPLDDKVQDHEWKHRRRSSVLVLPGELPAMPQAPQRIKTREGMTPADVLKEGVQVVPDFTIGQDAMLTPKRDMARRRGAKRR